MLGAAASSHSSPLNATDRSLAVHKHISSSVFLKTNEVAGEDDNKCVAFLYTAVSERRGKEDFSWHRISFSKSNLNC